MQEADLSDMGADWLAMGSEGGRRWSSGLGDLGLNGAGHQDGAK